MRYQGGGIGHKYMREIEELYENMSRERDHHKERRGAPVPTDTAAVINSDDEGEPTGSSRTGAEADREGGGETDGDDSDDSDFLDADLASDSSSDDSDSDEFGSENEPDETYGLGDL